MTSPSRGRDNHSNINNNNKRSLYSRSNNIKASRSKKKRKRSLSAGRTFPLTENAVESLVRGIALVDTGGSTHNDGCHDEEQEQLVLRVRIDHATTAKASATRNGTVDDGVGSQEDQEGHSHPMLFGEACDGKQSVKIFLLDDFGGKLSRRLVKEKARNKKYDWIVGVTGYTSTEAAWSAKYKLHPIICLTSTAVLSTIKRKGSLSNYFPFEKLGSTRARAGTAGSFLAERAPFLSNEELGGCFTMMPLDSFLSIATDRSPPSHNDSTITDSSVSRTLFGKPVADSNAKRIQDFLAFAAAMKTFKEASSSSPPQSPLPSRPASADSTTSLFSPTKLPTEHASDLYDKTLAEFTASQMDRQNASLGSNAGRESAERAALIVQRHKDVLELAMRETKPLTLEVLRGWHGELLKDIHPEAGEIRTRTVRCGQTVFCPTSRIHHELEKYCNGLSVLSKRLDRTNALHAILYAAVAMYGIIDIHPFLDGNGRLSRIVANYALKDVPFPINLFATPAQRAEYVLALEQTRHILSTSGKGDFKTEHVLEVIKFTGAFDSLTQLLMDRVAKAASECNKVWQEKSGMAAEAAEARAARRVRERAAQGTCIICFEDRPNIATLCCGKATHLNCIAEWLSGKNTCPVCRSDMPSISGRVVRAAIRSEEDTVEEGRDVDVSDALEAAQQQVLQNIRETRDLLAREYDRVARGNGGDSDSSDDSSFLSDPSEASVLDTTTTTTSSDEEANQLLFNHLQAIGAFQPSGSDSEYNTGQSDDSDATSDGSNIPTGGTRNRSTYQNGSENDDSTQELYENGEYETTTTTTDAEIGHSADIDDIRAQNQPNPAGSLAGNEHEYFFEGEAPRSRQRLTPCMGHECRNQAAVDCANHLCGRCCVLGGEFHCDRHNS